MAHSRGLMVRAAVALAAGSIAAVSLSACGGAYDIPQDAAAQARATAYAKAAGEAISPPVFQRSTAPAGSTFAEATNKEVIRCYFKAALTTSYKVPTYPGTAILPPYLSASTVPGSETAFFKDPAETCAQSWDAGEMNPNGINDDLIPKNFASPVATYPSISAGARDANGNLLPPSTGNIYGQPRGIYVVIGNYIPPLMVCVVDGTVAVIPGSGDVCAALGIPALRPGSS